MSSFYPEDKFPKEGNKVLNTEGEQYNISNSIYKYQDGIENTSKITSSSTDNHYKTIEGALTRAEQLGCGGYHTEIIDGITYYVPCSDPDFYLKRIEQLNSSIGFSYIGNYRILSYNEPFMGVKQINGIIIDCNDSRISENPIIDQQCIAIDFRYSIDNETWSLWTSLGTTLNIDANKIFPINLDPNNKFYPEFRFTSVLLNDDGTIIYNSEEIIDPSVTLLDFDLDLEFDREIYDNYYNNENIIYVKPAPNCSDEYSEKGIIFDKISKETFQPYNINKSLNIYQDLSNMVNNLFGIEANYYSIQPQGRGRDVILKEYTLFNVVEEKCIKILVQNNAFPDNRLNFDPFGIQFDSPFEVNIDKKYFESIFGRGSQPRKRDILYFPITNRIYEINSTYLFRDFMYNPVYFKIELQKYQPRSNTYFQDPSNKEELDDLTLSTEKLLGNEISNETKKVSNPLQNRTIINNLSQDPNRSYVYKGLPIIEYDLNNNWTIVFNNYYDLSEAFIDNSEFTYAPKKVRNAIRYKQNPILLDNSELSYTAWFSIRNYYDNSNLLKRGYPILNMELLTDRSDYNPQFLHFNTYPYKHNLSAFSGYKNNPNGYVSIKGDYNHSGGYEVIECPTEYEFKVLNRKNIFPEGQIKWKMQKAQSRNLLDGLYSNNEKGIRIDIIHSGVIDDKGNLFLQEGSIVIKLNDIIINSPFQFIPEYGDWYGIVINISNIYKQVGFNIWKMSYDSQNIQEQSTNLKKIHSDGIMLDKPIIFNAPQNIVNDLNSPYYETDENSYKINTSPLYLSNIRLFKNMIDIDKQSIVLNQNMVRDNHLAYIIDNANPLLNIPKFARNR